jgi:hypothetical protein
LPDSSFFKPFSINLECDNLLSLSSPGINSRHKQNGDESPHSKISFSYAPNILFAIPAAFEYFNPSRLICEALPVLFRISRRMRAVVFISAGYPLLEIRMKRDIILSGAGRPGLHSHTCAGTIERRMIK